MPVEDEAGTEPGGGRTRSAHDFFAEEEAGFGAGTEGAGGEVGVDSSTGATEAGSTDGLGSAFADGSSAVVVVVGGVGGSSSFWAGSGASFFSSMTTSLSSSFSFSLISSFSTTFSSSSSFFSSKTSFAFTPSSFSSSLTFGTP